MTPGGILDERGQPPQCLGTDDVLDLAGITGGDSLIHPQHLGKESLQDIIPMGDFCRGWAKQKFELFCEERYASNTLTTIKNTRNINVGDVIKAVKAKHNTIFSAGYGQLKDKTFRIAHMGDITIDEVKEVCGWINDEIH